MEDENLLEKFSELSARLRGIRDVVAQLVAYESQRQDDQEVFFKSISDATNFHLYAAEKKTGKEPSEKIVAFQESVRAEVDWIVGEAQRMVSGKLAS